MCLHAAARKGHMGVVKALLSKGATVDTKTKVGPSVDEFLFSPHLTGICIHCFLHVATSGANLLVQKKVFTLEKSSTPPPRGGGAQDFFETPTSSPSV